MVKLGFYLLSAMMLSSVWGIISQAAKKQKLLTRYLIGVALWLIYIVILSSYGLLDEFGLPPRIPLLVVLPAIIIFWIATSQQLFKQAIVKTPLAFPIYIQSFRIIVELLIYGAYWNDVLPREVTFHGTNYDILVGISAPLVGYLVTKKIIGTRGLWVWNVVALFVLSLTVYTFISSHYFADSSLSMENRQFVYLPYLLLPAILLPFAIFYHIVSIKQIQAAQFNDKATT